MNIRQIPEFAQLMDNADHIDIKTIDGTISMREFVANMLSYQPGWMTFLYRVRWVFVRLLGMSQKGVPQPARMQPEDVPMSAGERAYIFKVEAAEEEKFWIAGASESHLDAYLGVAQDGRNFQVITIVHYNSWTGPIYFNTIRPFHHIVVNQMMKAGITASGQHG